MTTCKNEPVQFEFDIEGHRGCRGLYPENTIPAFKHALELGVTTLEMDLVITKDKKVLVSHDPFFSHEISTAPDGSEITIDNQFEHVIYRLNYDEIKKYDVGLKPNPRFPDQKKISAYKPLLSEVIEMTKEYCTANGKELPYFNIEIKSKLGFETRFHPTVENYVNLVMEVVESHDIRDKVLIQSFDTRAINYLHKAYPKMVSVYLVENTDGFELNMRRLTHVPNVYSPDYQLVDSELIKACHDLKMRIIPWTVNEKSEMEKLISLGVDGIITDYPNILIELMGEK